MLLFVSPLAVALSAFAPAYAGIDVPVGTGTLQAAVDAAAPGATLMLHDGVYKGRVRIEKPLKLVCAGLCTIDAQCNGVVALDILEQKVLVKTSGRGAALTVQGGESRQIHIASIKVQLRGVTALYNAAAPCGDEQYGIELTGSSTTIVKLAGVKAVGNPIGLLLDGLPYYTKIDVQGFVGDGNGAGIIVQDSASATKPGGSHVRIDKSTLTNNDVGVAVNNSDGIRISRTAITAGPTSTFGILLDANADDALISKCTWSDPGGTSTAFQDAGMGTCGSGNVGFTVPSCH